jgi:hypothetical protein
MTKALTPQDLTCKTTGKRMFVNEEAALRGMQNVWERSSRKKTGAPWTSTHMPRKVYECPACGWWHLSSSMRD